MTRGAVAVLCALALSTCGCRDSGQPDRIAIQPVEPSELMAPPPQPQDEWDLATGAVTLKEPASTVFVPATEARACPEFQLYRSDNARFTIKPGQPPYIEPGYVTLLVFWKMERMASQGMARHVSDLVKKYRQLRVRAIGVVEEGVSVRQVQEFANAQGLAFPIYFDLYEALPELREEIGATDHDRPFSAVFILDRRMRLRFYRGEFVLAAGFIPGEGGKGPGLDAVGESAPPGKAIEDYLVKILKER